MKTDNRSRRRALLTSAAAPAIALALMATAAQAQEPAKTFAIAPQPLADALLQFSKQADIDIVASTDLTRGRTAPKVAGEMTTADAMSALLAGSGLIAAPSGAGYVITRASDPQSGSAAGDGAEGTVQALIVTAQKREENIQDVPIAMSAFTQEDLTRSQIAGGPDLITQVPNMTFTKTNFSSYSIQLRGIGTQAISATTDPGVAVAFNNTPFIQNRFFEQEFYDLQRVEVLRGPQGTLYGRNATAGVVNIISQKPRFNYEAKLSGDVSNYSSSRLEGMINIPLVEDKVALRMAGAWTKRDGFVTNSLTGNQTDGRNLWSTRVSLRIDPSDKIQANLIWEHFQENDDRLRSGKQLCDKDVVTQVGGIPIQYFEQTLENGGVSGAPFAGVQPTLSQGCKRESLYSPNSFQTPNGAMLPYYLPLGGLGLATAYFDPYVSATQSKDLRAIESTVDPKYKASSNLGELQVSWTLTDNLTLASETAYNTDYVWSLEDFNRFNTKPGVWDTGPGRGANLIARGILSSTGVFCDPQFGCSDRLVAVDLSTAKGRQFSQEFRLSSDFGGKFNFSLGANFLRYDTVAKYYVFFNSLTLVSAGIASSFAPLSGPSVPWVAGVSDNHECAQNGNLPGDPRLDQSYLCIYIEPSSIENIQDQGHNYFLSKNPYRLISYAAFGEAYYNITDTLKITGGLRWTVDQKHAPLIPSWVLAGSGTRGYPVLKVIDQEWREPTGRLAIDWKPDLVFTDQTLLYASYAHGYKAGGANPPPYAGTGVTLSATRPQTFEPEFVNAFELGSKNTFDDGRATLNLAAFYYDYKGYQISEIVDRSAFNRNFDATVWGLEIETDWRPLENVRLGFKGGYENTRIADGMQAIDLMDRTAGNPDWVNVRPFPTVASSCILPTALFTHKGYLGGVYVDAGVVPPYNLPVGVGGVGGGNAGGCELAYRDHLDPVTELPYVPNPTVSNGGSTDYTWPAPGVFNTYPGWDPRTAPNNGEGFFKQLGGNQLPNAPHFTGTITADYTLPLPNNWLMTLHTDLYAQSNAWWRVFNDNAYDKLHPYFTMNLAAIFTNDDAGWKVMAYVKNVLDRDSITGAFLNSDDTGLTTNVFLTEPRLYGLRVTKEWTGGSLLGSFGARHDGPYPLTLEIGGQIQRHDAPNDPVAPSFMDQFSSAIDPLSDQAKALDWGDGRDVKLTYQPGGDWRVSLGARFGKTNGSVPWATRSEAGDKICQGYIASCQPGAAYPIEYAVYKNYTISSTTDREDHTIVDFAVGKDFGIGALGEGGSSTIAIGLRLAELNSTTDAHIFGVTNWDITTDSTKYPGEAIHDRYDAKVRADRQFKGAGPVLSWEASKAVLGGKEIGVLGVDWDLGGGVLFGKRKTAITGVETAEHFDISTVYLGSENRVPDTTTATTVNIHRSQSVTVPTFSAGLGLSYKIDRMSIGAGYRWERYFNAIDGGGYSVSKEEDRTIDGPYFKISVGFGG